MRDRIKSDLKDMISLTGVSGAEQEVVVFIRERLSNICDSVEVTGMGMIIATIKGKYPGKKVIVSAHMDEIGMIVKNIDSNGFLTFEKVGDYSDQLLPGRKVWIQTKNGKIPGAIGVKPAHIMSIEDVKTVKPAEKLFIDVGASSKEEAKGYGIDIGTRAVFQSDYEEMANPDVICSRALDNRVGCAILMNLLESIDKGKLEGELTAVFTVVEETTIAGLVGITNQILPDCVIVLDTVPAGDVLDVNTDLELPVYLNRGPVLVIAQGDPSVQKFSCSHPKLLEAFHDVANSLGVNVQDLVLASKYYITDSVEMILAGKGTPSIAIAVPRRYSHTPVELLNINDVLKTYDILKEYFETKNGQLILEFC